MKQINHLREDWEHARDVRIADCSPENIAAEKFAWAAYYEAVMKPGPSEPLRTDIDKLAAQCEAEKEMENA